MGYIDEITAKVAQAKKESTPLEPPKERTPIFSENKHILDDMKTELEVAKLEFEREKLNVERAKLNKPDTSVDYYSKMLEMQQQFNSQVLAMQKQNFDTQLQLAKLELGTESETEKWLGFLEPYLPTLLGKFTGFGTQPKTEETPIYVHNERGEMIPNPEIYKRINTPLANKDNAGGTLTDNNSLSSSQPPAQSDYDMEIKQYQQKIREGKISLEQAWKDWNDVKPQLPKWVQNMTYEEFKENYDKLRGQK